jgi:hypothetical protein
MGASRELSEFASLVSVSSGNVGVGTSSPTSLLDVRQSNPTRGIVASIVNSATSSQTGAQLRITQGGIEDWVVGQPAATNAFSIWSGRSSSSDGTERMRIDSSGNVGIGQTPTAYGATVRTVEAYIAGAAGYTLVSAASASVKTEISAGEANLLGQVGTRTNHPLAIKTNDTERARIDSSGNLLVGTTTFQGKFTVTATGATTIDCARTETTLANQIVLRNGNGAVGSITTNGSATAYNTSSDYRLKHDIAPMQNALATVAQLKPVTYKWNVDDSESQGFIAHELQAVVPDCVTGEKDAVDSEGNPQYQGIDTSFLVATLTAAIQEQQQMIETLQAKVAALEAR